jgi:hypothetical protein
MSEVEVEITNTGQKAVIEGKTSVPFKTFVTLILQRKVQTLFKTSQDEPVIVNSTLLTALASAPGDKQEDKGKLVLVTMGVGVIVGVFFTVAIFLVLKLLNIQPELKDLGIVLAVIAGIVVLGVAMMKNQKKSGFTEKLFDAMEKTTDLISR